ncbi:hypothetical protein MASR2M70_19030 [Bacillota bacterium]
MGELIQRIIKVDLLIAEWFIKTKRTDVRPPEIEQYLISKCIYTQCQRPGRQLRSDLRELERRNRLDIFTHVTVQRNPNYWCFLTLSK